MMQSSTLLKVCRRHLHMHEYQSKALMTRFNISTQRFGVITAPSQAHTCAAALSCDEYVIKAQIMAGGRGKGTFSNGFQGGVHLSRSLKEVEEISRKMLGSRLRTKQTSEDGVLVNKVMIAEALNIEREAYFAILLDRESGGPVLVGSPRGGVDIEAVAEQSPADILTVAVDVTIGPTKEQIDRLVEFMGFRGDKSAREAGEQVARLYKLFTEVDATQVEVNPFGETPEGRVVCFDAKINFDDNAEFRQKAIFGDRDLEEEDRREVEAGKFGLNYIGMAGRIGCLVNGAGLAMATMDIIKLNGGSPANFLDVGGSATRDQVKEAFRIITSDKQVKTILVNIFGGIMKCDTIAEGIVAAAREVPMDNVPIIVRLAGTNVDEGKRILAESGLAFITADDLDDAARKAVAASHDSDEAPMQASA